MATVVEGGRIPFKVTGYDNVGAERIKVRGIREQPDGSLRFTGRVSGADKDVLDGSQIPLETVPGDVNGYQALRLVDVPALPNGKPKTFPVAVQVWDKAGNASTARFRVRADPDGPPRVTRVETDRKQYLPRDTLRVNVGARDEKAVEQITLKVVNARTGQVLREVQHRGGASEAAFTPGSHVT
ncbi:MAG: hypothetical protein ABEK42_07300, partial [Thiohalorhabdaceae bacterium]